MGNRKIAALILLCTFIFTAMAQVEGVSFEHKNWGLACDNTYTCRAAGYSDGDDPSGSVLLTRIAGPGTVPTGKVTLADMKSIDPSLVEKLTLWINDKPAGVAKPEKNKVWCLTESQTLALIHAVNGSGKVEFKGGPVPFVLSGEGAAAVFLKMDDVQGRIGTPGALVKAGNEAESGVPAAIPSPIIQAITLIKEDERPLTPPEIAMLKPKLLATLKEDGCDRLFSPQDKGKGDITLTTLDKDHALISALCWRAAYSEGYAYRVIDRALKASPVLVTDSASSYDQGVIFMSQRGRGIADCMSSASWVWDGEAFRKSSESTTGMCRYVHLGCTWDLPTFVSDIKSGR